MIDKDYFDGFEKGMKPRGKSLHWKVCYFCHSTLF